MYRAGARVEQIEFPVSTESTGEFRAPFRTTFLEDLGGVDRYEIATTPGRDVMIAHGFLVDVVSHVPPDSAGNISTTVCSTWEAPIVLELRDSMSHEILARTVERERPEGAVSVDNVRRETRLLIRRWSLILCVRPEELAAISVP